MVNWICRSTSAEEQWTEMLFCPFFMSTENDIHTYRLRHRKPHKGKAISVYVRSTMLDAPINCSQSLAEHIQLEWKVSANIFYWLLPLPLLLLFLILFFFLLLYVAFVVVILGLHNNRIETLSNVCGFWCFSIFHILHTHANTHRHTHTPAEKCDSVLKTRQGTDHKRTQHLSQKQSERTRNQWKMIDPSSSEEETDEEQIGVSSLMSSSMAKYGFIERHTARVGWVNCVLGIAMNEEGCDGWGRERKKNKNAVRKERTRYGREQKN